MLQVAVVTVWVCTCCRLPDSPSEPELESVEPSDTKIIPLVDVSLTSRSQHITTLVCLSALLCCFSVVVFRGKYSPVGERVRMPHDSSEKESGGRNSSVGSAWARCPQHRGFDPPLGTFSVEGIFSLELT